MDTTTVLEIIKMLDNEINDYNRLLAKAESKAWQLQKMTLEMFKDHLQSFIEGQLNAAENSTNEEDYYYLDWGI